MNESVPQPVVADPPETIDSNTLCVSCAYNLRGLTVDHNCPECGTPINRSLRGNLLEFCDPKWVSRLATGAGLTLAACWCLAAAIVLLIVLVSIGGAETPVWLALHLVTTSLFVLGAWLLTSPDPRDHMQDAPGRAKRLARVGLCVVLGEDSLLVASAMWFKQGTQLLILLRTVTAVAWMIVFCTHLRHLATRSDHEAFRQACRRCLICLKILGVSVVTLALLLLVDGVLDAMEKLTGLPLNRPCFLTPIAIPVIVYCQVSTPILGLISFFLVPGMLSYARKAFRKAADNARSNWIGPTGPP